MESGALTHYLWTAIADPNRKVSVADSNGEILPASDIITFLLLQEGGRLPSLLSKLTNEKPSPP